MPEIPEDVKQQVYNLCKLCVEDAMKMVKELGDVEIKGVWSDHVQIAFDEVGRLHVTGRTTFGKMVALSFAKTLHAHMPKSKMLTYETPQV